MNEKKSINIEVIICIILGVVILILGAMSFKIFTKSGSKSVDSVNKTNVITEGTDYSSAIDTQILEKPSEGAAVKAQLPKDSKVTFISYADKGYYKVKFNDVSGYVNGDYIIDSKLLKEQEDAQKANMYIVNCTDNANMYAAADLNSTVTALIPLGTPVTAWTNAENGFNKVTYNNGEGYIESKCLTADALQAQQQKDQAAQAVQQQQAAAQAQQQAAAAAAAEQQRKASLPAGSSATTPLYSMWVCNVANAIYLRTNPSDDADVITTIPLNTEVKYIDTWGEWCKISYNGRMGYSKSQYLTTSRPSSGYTSNGTTSTMVVSNVDNSAYFRRNPTGDTSSANIICTIPKGTAVTCVGISGDYYRVNYRGTVGYIYYAYLNQ